MAESNGAPVQAVQNGSIQEVQIINKSITEGYQPLPLERKGYQPTDTPPPQSPPQSILSTIPVSVSPPVDAGAAPPTTSTQSQATSASVTDQSK
jgi:hypothetical protein